MKALKKQRAEWRERMYKNKGAPKMIRLRTVFALFLIVALGGMLLVHQVVLT